MNRHPLRDLTMDAENVTAEGKRLKLEFIDVELQTAATFIRLAETESGIPGSESAEAVQRLHAKARQALDGAAKLIEDAERHGQETSDFRKRLRQLSGSLARRANVPELNQQ